VLPLSDPILVFTVLILTLLAAPLLAERLRVPDLVLLLLAGVLLGPKGFGVLERDTAVTLFGSVGLLYIVFLAGLEIDLERFARTGGRSVTFGLITFSLPQGLGLLAARYILGFDWVSAVLLASMFASHTLLMYPIASRLGIGRAEPVVVTVSGSVVTDTLALLVLAVIANSVRGVDLGLAFWAEILLGMVGLLLLTLVGVPRLTRWFFGNVTEAGGAQFLFVLAILCACAYLSHFAKLQPVIGAFLAGVAFNRLIPRHSVLMNRVVFTGTTLFIPFFLISVGMLVDPIGLVSDPRAWLVTGTMVVMVVSTKFAAAWLSGRLFGYSRDGTRVMFGLSVVQAAGTLAAVLIGYELGIFGEAVLNGAIAMIAVTGPLGAWMVERHGRRLAEQALPLPPPPGAEQRLLVPVANPAYADRMLNLAFLLRDKERPGAIHPITIVRDDDEIEASVAQGEQLLAHCLAHASSAEMAVSPSVRVAVNKTDGILRAAKELRISLLLAGWGGEATARTRLFGTVMETLIDQCPQRLLFCRLVRPLNTTRRLLVLLPPLVERRGDLKPLLAEARHLARQAGADLRVYLSSRAQRGLKRAVEGLRPSRTNSVFEAGSFAEARARLLAEIGDDDLVLLLGERRGGVLWMPAQDRLPETVIARFPDNNLLLAYPPLLAHGDEALAQDAPGSVEPLRIHPCQLPSGEDLAGALQRMTRKALPSAESAEEARRLLLAAANGYPVQLSPQIVLLHGHAEALGGRMLLVAAGGDWHIRDTAPGSRILLALLVPKAAPPEQHLRTLAALGRLGQDEAALAELHAAEDAEALGRLLAVRLSEA
jgi:Kef-type K+ transport system membrane component KefB